MNDDAQLWIGFASNGDEAAFSELVNRHVNLVYSVALRLLGGDAHLAQDVTQTVFTYLARKAKSLPHDTVLSTPDWDQLRPRARLPEQGPPKIQALK